MSYDDVNNRLQLGFQYTIQSEEGGVENVTIKNIDGNNVGYSNERGEFHVAETRHFIDQLLLPVSVEFEYSESMIRAAVNSVVGQSDKYILFRPPVVKRIGHNEDRVAIESDVLANAELGFCQVHSVEENPRDPKNPRLNISYSILSREKDGSLKAGDKRASIRHKNKPEGGISIRKLGNTGLVFTTRSIKPYPWSQLADTVAGIADQHTHNLQWLD